MKTNKIISLLPNRLTFVSRHSKVLVVAILLVAAITSLSFLRFSKAVDLGWLEAETGTVTSSASIVADSTASGGQAVLFGSTVAPPAPPPNTPNPTPPTPSAKPGPHNTGPTGILQPCADKALDTPGQVVENCSFVGQVTIGASNVTLRNFRLDGSGSNYGIRIISDLNGIVIEDGEILNISSTGILGMGFTARRLNIHESGGDGIKAQGGSTNSPVLVEASWIHHLGTNVGAHADGNQTRSGGSPIIFRGNNCDMPISDPDPYKSNACFMLQTAEGPVVDFLIEDNWLNGGNYTIYCVPNTTVRNNLFGRDYRYGVKRSCDTWIGNTWEDTGAAIN